MWRDKLRVEGMGLLKFRGSLLLFPGLTKSYRKFEMGGCVVRDRMDGRAKLRNSAGQIANIAQTPTGVGGK